MDFLAVKTFRMFYNMSQNTAWQVKELQVHCCRVPNKSKGLQGNKRAVYTVTVLSSEDGSRSVGNTALTLLVHTEEQDACNTSDLWEAKLWS